MTLVSRLVNKEFIDVIREDKSLLVYKPKVSEYDYKSKETNNFIEKLYNGSINNMLVAGRCISSTHEAQASYRIMPIVSALGEAAGIAAGVANKAGVDVSDADYKEIQSELLKAGAFIG